MCHEESAGDHVVVSGEGGAGVSPPWLRVESVTSGETVAEFAHRWLRDFPRAESSARVYRYAVGGFVDEYGDRRMGSITMGEALRWMRDYPAKSYRLRTMFADAMAGAPRDRAVSYNPFERVTRKRGRGCSPPPSWREVEELADIALELLPPIAGVMSAGGIRLAFYGLLRTGELLGAEHEDVDIERHRLRVERRWSDAEGTVDLRLHRRLVALPEAARNAYELLPVHPDRRQILWAPHGKRVSTCTWSRWWRTIRDEWAGRESGRDPALTFGWATRAAGMTTLHASGMPADLVARMAGLRNGSFVTERLFAHGQTEAALNAWRTMTD